ncbi:hypothetical protein [Virgibacillus sp. Bac330]|nr:hypothetical protein [Virgibacillus sp. Bac330]
MTLKDKRIAWKARYDAWKESGQRSWSGSLPQLGVHDEPLNFDTK